MAVLKCEKELVVKVNSCDLDRFIREVFGKQFNFAAREGLESGSSREVLVSGGFSPEEVAAVKQELDTNWDACSTDDLLSYCASAGLIEQGMYIIKFDD